MSMISKEFNLGVEVEPDSKVEIKNSILYIIDHQEQLLRNMQSEHYANSFSYDKFANTIFSIYD
jgi:hypothetical protein